MRVAVMSDTVMKAITVKQDFSNLAPAPQGGKKRPTCVFLFKASTQKFFVLFYCMPGWLFKTGGILRPRWGTGGQIVFMTH